MTPSTGTAWTADAHTAGADQAGFQVCWPTVIARVAFFRIHRLTHPRTVRKIINVGRESDPYHITQPEQESCPLFGLFSYPHHGFFP